MRSGNPNIKIPVEIPIGLSNGGRGFYRAVQAMGTEISFEELNWPADMVVPDGNGGMRWIREPHSSYEQYLHCMFHLRELLKYFATHPVGKMTKGGSDNIAAMLTSLPPRYAFVRSGDDQGTIRTFDSPKGVEGLELNQRLQQIQRQTRETYCHPREEVEGRLRDKPAVNWMGQIPIEHSEEVDDDDDEGGQTVRITRVPRGPTPRR
jgi:hypothetical protein